MSDLDDLPAPSPTRPLWLVTLADLALLLLGFLVLVQATSLDHAALARGLRAGFDAPALSVAASAIDGFAPGSARLPDDPAAAIAWTRNAARDPRVRITLTGAVDGSPRDVDPASGAAALLASDRARALAAALIDAGAIAPGRIAIAAAGRPARRGVTLTLAFIGDHP